MSVIDVLAPRGSGSRDIRVRPASTPYTKRKMRSRFTGRAMEVRLRSGLLAAAVSLILLVGCERGAADLVRDIDAAREGCTEEMLKAADEECMRMFERYADMAAGAMETYIGGMRAFDEAIRRRSGVLFDTAGLGSALGDGLRRALDPSAADPTSRVRVPARDPWQSGGYAPQVDPYFETEAYGPVTGGRWSDPLPGGPTYTDPYGQAGDLEVAGGSAVRGRAPTVPRGVLLPPDERLRRPWLDGGEPDDRYVDEPRPREPAGDQGVQDQGQGWYPAGEYPYGGTGSAYPYPQQPDPGGYPYPGGRPGTW